MNALAYFDTDCFHHFASVFENCALRDDLREKIVFSPVTMMEMFSHLAREWGDKVLKQIKGLQNWIVADHALILPWMDAAVSHIGFGIEVKDDEYTTALQADINRCANAELSKLLDVARTRDAELKQVKQEYADIFRMPCSTFAVGHSPKKHLQMSGLMD